MGRPGDVSPTDTLTDTAYVEPLFGANEHRDFSAGGVTFLPGMRSHWHTHPRGQILVITGGTGWTRERGRQRELIRAVDVIWCPPGTEHWHGATGTTAVTHIALQAVAETIHWIVS